MHIIKKFRNYNFEHPFMRYYYKKMENLKENKKIDFPAGIFKGTKSACKYLCMHSQNLLCIFLEFCTSYIYSKQNYACIHIQKRTKIIPKKSYIHKCIFKNKKSKIS